MTHERFSRLGTHLRDGDLLVVNNSKVFPARLRGAKPSGGKVELLLLRREPEDGGGGQGAGVAWACLLRASRRAATGEILHMPEGRRAEIVGESEGVWRVRFDGASAEAFEAYLERVGLPPLPPYIKRSPGQGDPAETAEDRERYQTVFARVPGSVAAPTAGFHFSDPLCRELAGRGIEFAEVTLHVGQFTFLPIRTADIREHRVWPERYRIEEASARRIHGARKEGRRVVAVGTTTVRCLEHVAASRGDVLPGEGEATNYILPGTRFGVVDALITNFHLPGSSLLVLVSAFAGRGLIQQAYAEAIRTGYRFFSYGDCMFIQ